MASGITNIIIKAKDLASKPIKGVGGSLGKLAQTAGRLRYTFVALGAVIGGFGLAREFIEANSQLEDMQLRLKAVLGTASAGNEAFAWIEKFQKDAPVRSLQEYTDTFIELTSAGIDPTTGALKALTAGAVKFNLSASDVSGITRAIRQMGALSNAQKQELNQLAERIPGVQAKIAAALGKTTGQLKTEMKQGLVASQDVIKAIFDTLGADGDAVIASFGNSWKAVISRIETAWFKMMNKIGQTGIWEDMKAGVDRISSAIINNMDSIATGVKIVWDFMRDSAKAFFDIDFGNGVFLKSFQAIGEFLGSVLSNFFKGLAVTEVILRNMAKIAINFINELNEGTARAGMSLRRIFTEDGLEEEIARVQAKLTEHTVWMEKKFGKKTAKLLSNNEHTTKLENSLKTLKGYLTDIKGLENPFTTTVGKDAEELQKRLEGLIKAQETLSKNLRAMKSEPMSAMDIMFQDALDATPTPMNSFKEQMGKLTQENSATQGDKTAEVKVEKAASHYADTWQDALARVQTNFDEVYGNMEKIQARLAETMTKSLTDGIMGVFDELLNGRIPDLRTAFVQIGNDIIKMMLRVQAEKVAMGITSAIFGAFAGGGSLNGVTPSSGGTAGSLDSIMGSASGGGGMLAKATSVEIINNSGVPMQATTARVKGDRGEEIMSVVMDAVGRNKGGSRDSLKALMG